MDALDAGMTVSRLRSADLTAPFRGVRSVGTLHDATGRAMSYAPLLLPGQHFSHTTAAGILGLRMPDGFREQTIHVTSLAPDRAPRGRGITGHQTDRDIQLFITRSGLLVTHPWATSEQLNRAVDQWRGMRGAKRLAAATY